MLKERMIKFEKLVRTMKLFKVDFCNVVTAPAMFIEFPNFPRTFSNVDMSLYSIIDYSNYK